MVKMYSMRKTLMQTSITYVAIFLAEGMNQKNFPREY